MTQKSFANMHESVHPLRTERLRVVRRKRRMVLLGVCACVCVVLCGGALWASHSEHFVVRAVTIEGTHVVSEDAIRSLADSVVHDGRLHLVARTNIAFYPKDEITQALLQTFPRISDVHIRVLSWQDRTIVITITERTDGLLWCTDIDNITCYRIDGSGFVFEAAPYSEGAHTFYGVVEQSERHGAEAPLWGQLEPSYFEQTQRLIQGLEAFSFDARSVRFEDHDVWISLANGFDIRADVRMSADDTVNALISVLAQKDLAAVPQTNIDYIDVRFGERVFYKLKPQE